MINIRQAHESDLPYIYEICLMTADAGKDASALLSDSFIVAQYYAAPYIVFEKDMCFVLTDNNIPVGYIVGTSDTFSFNKWFNQYWLPPLRQQYPLSTKQVSDLEKNLIEIINTDVINNEQFADYPAHLHIDILSSHHGKGYGKLLMNRFIDKCKEKKCKGIYFGVDNKNENALRFYSTIGMQVLKEGTGVIFMGIRF